MNIATGGQAGNSKSRSRTGKSFAAGRNDKKNDKKIER